MSSDFFSYFSYGSNMLASRILINNPTARFISIGRLDNYRLDFIRYSKTWGGPTATLVPTANAHVWGVLWKLHNDDLQSLDGQEGVDKKIYFVKFLNIETPYEGAKYCRVYIQVKAPLPRGDNDVIPVEQQPSYSYRKVMIFGAIEHGLPECYIRELKKIKHNGDRGCIRMYNLLNRYAKEKPCDCRVPGRIPRKLLKLDVKTIRRKKPVI